MRFRFPLLIVFLSLTFSSYGATLGSLEYLDGVYCAGDHDNPYTGIVEGKHHGLLINGIREGSWISKWSNGAISSQGSYQHGKKDGLWIGYTKEGAVDPRLTGTYKNGVRISE